MDINELEMLHRELDIIGKKIVRLQGVVFGHIINTRRDKEGENVGTEDKNI